MGKQKLRCYYWDSGEKYFYEVRWPFVPCYHALLCKDNCLLIKKAGTIHTGLRWKRERLKNFKKL